MGFSKERLKEMEQLETEDTKYCIRCKKIKSLVDFHFNPVARKFAQSFCIKCDRKRANERSIFASHGITLKQYDKMLEKQFGKCKICKTEVPGGPGRFHIDHDHSTGKIRGLLCSNCNLFLGNAKDNIEILASAIQYLTDSRK